MNTHTAYTYSYNDSLCSWISLLRHRVDDRTSHAGSTQTGFSFYHVRLFFFFNSSTILVFLALTLPFVRSSDIKRHFYFEPKNWPLQTFNLFICAQTAAVSAGVCEPHCSTISITVLLFFKKMCFLNVASN